MVSEDMDSYMQTMNLNHQLTPYTKINLRWSKDLNTTHDTIKTLENMGRKISDIPHNDIFTDMSVPRVRDIRVRINTWDYVKLKSFCTAKENIIKMKREPTLWENIFANDTSDKGLISKINSCKYDILLIS